ncbi:MAG: hypothetical protein HFG15_01520 [Bacilli bacterium]|nr:hypothetical protein [Bacilli bacterium]
MKKDRNCGCPGNMAMPYGGMPVMPGAPMPGGMPGGMPVYPMGPGMAYPMPNDMNTMPTPSTGSTMNSNSGITTNQAVTAVEQLQAQINNIDRRVSRLESMIQDTKSTSFSSNKYTDSNYHMM